VFGKYRTPSKRWLERDFVDVAERLFVVASAGWMTSVTGTRQ
jgi:hypothetical protein